MIPKLDLGCDVFKVAPRLGYFERVSYYSKFLIRCGKQVKFNGFLEKGCDKILVTLTKHPLLFLRLPSAKMYT